MSGGTNSEKREMDKIGVKKESWMHKLLDHILDGILVILFLPFMLILLVFNLVIRLSLGKEYGKCKHYKNCPWYDDKSPICTKDDGYYSFDKPSGCYYTMEEREKRKGDLEELY